MNNVQWLDWTMLFIPLVGWLNQRSKRRCWIMVIETSSTIVAVDEDLSAQIYLHQRWTCHPTRPNFFQNFLRLGIYSPLGRVVDTQDQTTRSPLLAVPRR